MVRDDVVIHHPRVGEVRGEELPKCNRPSASRPAIHLRPDDTQRQAFCREHRLVYPWLACIVDDQNLVWSVDLCGDGNEASGQRLWGIVGEHKRQDSTLVMFWHRRSDLLCDYRGVSWLRARSIQFPPHPEPGWEAKTGAGPLVVVLVVVEFGKVPGFAPRNVVDVVAGVDGTFCEGVIETS